MRGLTLPGGNEAAVAMPVEDLTPLLIAGDPRPPDLHRDLDANGMRNPLLVVPLSIDEWAVLVCERSQARQVVPAILPGPTGPRVVAVRVGNQRLAWAVSRGYDRVPVVVCDSFEGAEAWRERWYV